jgi:hypothetical protein
MKPDLIIEQLGAGVALRAVSPAGQAFLLTLPLAPVVDDIYTDLILVEDEPEIPPQLTVWRVMRRRFGQV